MADYAGKGVGTASADAGRAGASADSAVRQHQALAQGAIAGQRAAVALQQPDGKHAPLQRDSAKRFPR